MPVACPTKSLVTTTLCFALFANNSARKQLKSALQMQEQTKNVSLLEQRMIITETIRQNKLPSETSVKILFNKEIVDCFFELTAAYKAYTDAEQDEQTYFNSTNVQNKIGEWTNPIKNKFKSMSTSWNAQTVQMKFSIATKNIATNTKLGGRKPDSAMIGAPIIMPKSAIE